MNEIKAVDSFEGITFDDGPIVFLAGSIEMGAAELWQDRLKEAVLDLNCVLLNPRRDDWDSSWVQDPTPGTQFNQQVVWELDGQEAADIHVFYFDPATKSPITLLELGLAVGRQSTGVDGTAIVVCCHPDFYRYGNVAVLCNYYDIPLVHTFQDLVAVLREGIIGIQEFERHLLDHVAILPAVYEEN